MPVNDFKINDTSRILSQIVEKSFGGDSKAFDAWARKPNPHLDNKAPGTVAQEQGGIYAVQVAALLDRAPKPEIV